MCIYQNEEKLIPKWKYHYAFLSILLFYNILFNPIQFEEENRVSFVTNVRMGDTTSSAYAENRSVGGWQMK